MTRSTRYPYKKLTLSYIYFVLHCVYLTTVSHLENLHKAKWGYSCGTAFQNDVADSGNDAFYGVIVEFVL